MAPEVAFTSRQATLRSLVRVILPLFGARAGFRASMLLSAVVLLLAWGEQTFNSYALAVGSAAALSFLTSLGAEKCALKLIPRASLVRPQLTTIFVLLPLVPASLCLGWTVFYSSWSQAPLLVILAGCFAVSLGFNQVLLGLHRVYGRIHWDFRSYLILAAAVLSLMVGAVVLGIGPATLLATMLAVITVLNLLAVSRLRLEAPRKVRPSLARLSLGSSVQMSAAEICGSSLMSLIFILIGLSRFSEQAGSLYLVVEFFALTINAFGYLLRIIQPRVSVVLHRGDSARVLIGRARRGLRLIAGISPVYLAGLLMAGLWWEGLAGAPLGRLGLFALHLATLPILLGMSITNFVLENHERASLRSTAIGSVVGLLVGAGFAAATIPLWGAAAGVVALAVGDVAHAATVLRLSPPAVAASRRAAPDSEGVDR